MMEQLKRLWPFLAGLVVIAAVAFAFFYPDASQGNVLKQHDTQQGIAIGQEAKAYYEATGETSRWTNSLFSGMPTFQISPSYPSSRLFTWINTVMGLGLPSPSSLIAMMMVGFFILLLAMDMGWGLALLGAVAYGFSSYFVILIGAGHIWKFVTLAYIPPTVAGLILCYRGRYIVGGALAAVFAMMQIASNHVQMSYYFLFVVVAMAVAFLASALRHRRMRQWWLATGILAIAGGLAVVANLPSLYNTYEYSKETMRGRHSELTAIDTGTGNQQAANSKGLDRDYITQYSYQPSETFSLLIPNIKGGASMRPEQGQNKIMSLAEKLKEQKRTDVDAMEAQYMEYMSQYFGDPEGTNGPVYVGALIFALFLVGCVIVRGTLKWALLALTVFSICLAWGRHAMVFTDLMLTCVPMYAKFRTVESILVIAEFTIPLLAMMGLRQIVTSPDRAKYLRPVAYCFGISVGICVLAWLAPTIFGDTVTDNDRQVDQMITQQLLQQGYPQDAVAQFSLQSPKIYSLVEELRTGMVRSDALRSLLVLVVGLGFLVLYLRQKISTAVAVVALVAVTLVDLYTVNKRYVSHDSFVPQRLAAGPPIARTPGDELIMQDTTMNYRVMDIPRFYLADPSYYHKMIGGYHAAKLTRYQDLIDRHLAAFTRGEPTDADWNVLNMLNARYVVDFGGNPIYNPEAMGNAWFVGKIDYVRDADAEMAALSSINPKLQAVADRKFEDVLGQAQQVMPGDTIYETTYAPNRLTYKANSRNGGLAVFSEVFFPWGWQATIDGKPAQIGRVNYVLRALPIPAGQHEVAMVFDPQSLHATNTAATAAIIIIYIFCATAIAWQFRPRRKQA